MEPQRNVLLIIADDLGKFVGCYGSKSVQTPHIDNLASEGVRFDRAFASTASCSGSRSTIYTGLHTHENGQYGLNIFRTHFQTFPNVESAPQLFNRAGYRTGIIGKIHVGPDEVYSWQHRQESESRDVAWVGDQVNDFLARSKEDAKPFFLTVGFVDPHRDVTTRGGFGNSKEFDPRVKSLELAPTDVEVPAWLTDIPETRQELVEYYKAIYRTDQGVGFILNALQRNGLNENTLVIFTSDNGPPFIGSKTTLLDAGTCLPFIVRSPAGSRGIANPNMISYIDILPTMLDWVGINDSQSSTGASTVVGKGFASDFGRSPPRLGRSFLPILNRTDLLPQDEWQHHVFGSHTFHELHQYWPTRIIRNQRYKYHRNIAWRLDFPLASDLYASYTFQGIRDRSDEAGEVAKVGQRTLEGFLFRPAEELFDLDQDPGESKNLAENPAYQDILLELRGKLEAWQRQTADPWLYRDSQSLLMLRRYGNDGLKVPDRFDMGVTVGGLAKLSV